MSTTTVPPALTPATTSPRLDRPVGFVGVLRSEWLKLRSLRSNTAVLIGTAAIMFLVGLLFSAFVGGILDGGGPESGELTGDATSVALYGTMFAALVIGVLGVLSITAEYASGSIRSTLTMVPHRLPVLRAKIVVIAVVTFVTMLATALGVFLAGQALIGNGVVPTASLGDPGVLRAVIGTAGYLTGVALMGLAAGFLLRSTAAAISTLGGIFFLFPLMGAVVLPADWADTPQVSAVERGLGVHQRDHDARPARPHRRRPGAPRVDRRPARGGSCRLRATPDLSARKGGASAGSSPFRVRLRQVSTRQRARRARRACT